VDLLYKDESYKVVGAAMAVHQELGAGFLEAVYQEALEKEFISRNIPYQREVALPIYYKGKLLTKSYVADFIGYGKIVIELKAVTALKDEHQAQILNYLKATNFSLGLLFNFGAKSLEQKRIVR
jgi:GxxExxY protein